MKSLTDRTVTRDPGCNGGLLCDPKTGTGVPPASVAEWTLSDASGLDWYDVSLVDGFNLPMSITNNVGCPVADCKVDLGKFFTRPRILLVSFTHWPFFLFVSPAPDCPAQLRKPLDASGKPLGCLSACAANVDGNQQDSPNCCSGSHDKPATCPSSGVAFYKYFKDRCPNSYVYAYDVGHYTSLRHHLLTIAHIQESSKTALWNCPASKAANYELTFCP